MLRTASLNKDTLLKLLFFLTKTVFIAIDTAVNSPY